MTQRRAGLVLVWFACLVGLAGGCGFRDFDGAEGGALEMVGKEPSGGTGIRIEHVAFNVAEPVEMARWYSENLEMRVVREGPPPANGRFLIDAVGAVMIEVYRNPADAVPDYAGIDPLQLHVAFEVDDVDGVRERLIAAGATPEGPVETTPGGDRIAMLRDPWGLAIQFVHRAEPMLPPARSE
jgi:glyoxylase I family protein